MKGKIIWFTVNIKRIDWSLFSWLYVFSSVSLHFRWTFLEHLLQFIYLWFLPINLLHFPHFLFFSLHWEHISWIFLCVKFCIWTFYVKFRIALLAGHMSTCFSYSFTAFLQLIFILSRPKLFILLIFSQRCICST